jgi:hypothetical protein
MATHRSARGKRLRDVFRLCLSDLAGVSAVIEPFGLLAWKEEQLAGRKRSQVRGRRGKHCIDESI